MLVIENCNSLSEVRQKLIDGEEVRTARICQEAVSRQAVIDGINSYFHDEYYQRTSIQDCRDCLIEDVIKELPSVNPQPCEDAVSREMALEKMADYVASGYADSVEDFEEYSRIICQLPPVTPQPKTRRWIPVSEELPDKEGYYLCSVRYMYPPYNFFEPEKVKYMDDVTIQKFDGEFNIEVKAWMPLPEPMKEGD